MGESRDPEHFPEGSVLADASRHLWLLCGGAKFQVPDHDTLHWLYPAARPHTVDRAVADAISETPVDGTLLREEPAPIFVIYGGARFHVPDPWTLERLYDTAQVWNLWPGATAHLRRVPKDGTRLREEGSNHVYEIVGGRRRAVLDGAE